jgi:CBS domain-containing protein
MTHSGAMTDASASLPVSALTGDSVARIDPDASLDAVADALVAGEIGALVVGEGERPEGIISERDLVRAVAERRDTTGTTARDVAHTDLIWCNASATVHAVASEMMNRYVRHVLVEDEGALVGIVSARDLLGVYATGTDVD